MVNVAAAAELGPPPADTATIELADGRQLAYREYGDPEGTPVIFYHGGLNSRAFMPAWDKTDAVTADAGVRLLALDRPGYGYSSFDATRAGYAANGPELTALIRQVDGLTDAPAIVVLGYSSGGPNALAAADNYARSLGAAAAATCPVRVVGLVSPDGPYTEMESDRNRSFPHSMPITPEETGPAAEAMATNLRTTYEAMAGRPDRHKMLMTDIDEATRQGTAASAQDTLFERTQWDFRLEDVSPGLQVLLWQGNYWHSMVQHQNGPKFPMKMDLFHGLTIDA
jgi:pimeloyl-ACP methyl ester carboxylesterase